MTMAFLSTEVEGDTSSCRATAAVLGTSASELRAAADACRSSPSHAPQWRGRTHALFCVAAARDAAALERLAASLEVLARALDDFATTLDGVVSTMTSARADAAAAGLSVIATGIELGSPFAAPTLAFVSSGPAGSGVAAQVAAVVAAARERERRAHTDLAGALHRSRGESWLEDRLEMLGFAPPDAGNRIDRAAWAYGLGSLGVGVAADIHLERIARSHTYEFLAPEAGRADDLARRAASRANLVGKVGGPVGNLLSAGMSGKGQWDADRDNEDLSEADRRGRAVVRGTVEGGGAAAGAWAGGSAGAAIGTFIFPGVGTVVGGVVGGAVGGLAGSKAGQWVADGAVAAVDDAIDLGADAAEAIGDGVDAATDAVGEGLDAVGDGLEDAGGRLKDAGDWLVRWR